MMNLIPKPRRIEYDEGLFRISDSCAIVMPSPCQDAVLDAARALADDIQKRSFIRPDFSLSPLESGNVIAFELKPDIGEQAYRLTIEPETVAVVGGAAAGFVHGVQTLRQIVSEHGAAIPCLTIEDSPDFERRGFYHDVTRGKVPTLDTLLGLVDKMAFYKLNELQLYVEHTFAFRGHADVWAGGDPLTAEEILVLDEHCHRRGVDLVPSLSTFGHLYVALRSKRKEHLNELELAASEKPFSFRDRMAHYALDCSNPDSLAFVEDMIDEFAPLFTSKFFNICCDETWDLGRGRNAAAAEKHGTGRLYLSFLNKIMDVVRKHGRTPMFWGDIILRTPELVDELPKDAIALNWTYAPAAHDEGSRRFAEASMPFYVCPGVHGWNRWLNNIPDACANIANLAGQGKKYGAKGLLNTDWGDRGHVNLLSNSFHGMTYGAACSWNVGDELADDDFDARFSALELGDPSGEIGGLIRDAASRQKVGWECLSNWFDPSDGFDSKDREPKTGMSLNVLRLDAAELLAANRDIERIHGEVLARAVHAKPRDPLFFREFSCGCRWVVLTHQVVLLLKGVADEGAVELDFTFYEVADRIRRLEVELSELWHLRSKPSEYHRVKTVLLEVATRLDEHGRDDET